MKNIQKVLGSVVGELSDKHREQSQSLAYFQFWFGIGQTYSQTPSDLVLDAIFESRAMAPVASYCGFIYPTTNIILRFANDAESDPILGPHSAGLRSRFCARVLQEFFDGDLDGVRSGRFLPNLFYVDVNLIAHCANLGYLKENTIRDHILQSLISHSHDKLHYHQSVALVILFKIAGATFAAYVDPEVVDRCFELLNNNHCSWAGWLEMLQEITKLRERNWEGLPPPPKFTTGKPKPSGKNKEGPRATPIGTSLGLPKGSIEPQIPQSPSLESIAWETDTAPASPVTQSPPISVSTLSDFTTADPSDDESPFIDSTAITPHSTFYLEDGNVEVLCGNTLFRVHTSILSFHSPALRRMFTQTGLTSAESPNGCPRILSSDTAMDFVALLKMIYLPGFPERDEVPDFTTFSSLLRITAKYEMPAVRFRLLEVVRDAYPESFEGLDPSKQLGEGVFSGPTPHPNEVLNLFIQQKLTSALPMAYYMAARRGLDSLMDRRLPYRTTLSPEVLQAAISGLMKLREMERDETHRLIFGPKHPRACSVPKCPLRAPTGPAALAVYGKVFDHIVGVSQEGTKVLQVPEFYLDGGGDGGPVFPDICRSCVERWESGHADLREKVWARLLDVFGLKG